MDVMTTKDVAVSPKPLSTLSAREAALIGIACQDGIVVDEVDIDGLHLLEIVFTD